MASQDDIVNSWSAAREAKAVHYFTGRPCKRGHISLRYANNGQCVECVGVRYKERNEHFRETQKRSYQKNKEKRAEYNKGGVE